ncbi:MAG: STAS domain-containing protein [Phycisphaerae bacterium]
MKAISHSENGILVVALEGEIDTLDTEGLAESLDQIGATKPPAVAIDFSRVSYIASSGIALLIHFVQGVRRNGGKLRVGGVNPRVKTVLDMVNLKTLVNFDDTVEQSIAHLRT